MDIVRGTIVYGLVIGFGILFLLSLPADLIVYILMFIGLVTILYWLAIIAHYVCESLYGSGIYKPYCHIFDDDENDIFNRKLK